MVSKDHFKLMAKYNFRMNQQLSDATNKLSETEFNEDMGAYFGSILATINHILVGDLIWLSRFSLHKAYYPSLEKLKSFPQPKALDEILYFERDQLFSVRERVDSLLLYWVNNELQESDLFESLVYRNSKGIESERIFGELVAHLFNHQTHHRGQISTMLSQKGFDNGVTDFLIDIPELK